MERSLSVLLPVHNVQATLAATVAEVLEMAADLTSRFELVIIDDGSTDATSEVADELSRCYPQVRWVGHGHPQGRDAALRTGLERCNGEVVFVRHAKQRKLERLAQPSGDYHPSKPIRPNYLGRKRQRTLES